jgi:hypothetical protein
LSPPSAPSPDELFVFFAALEPSDEDLAGAFDAVEAGALPAVDAGLGAYERYQYENETNVELRTIGICVVRSVCGGGKSEGWNWATNNRRVWS